MGDEQVRKEVWDGSVPVCFSLDDDEVGFNRRNLPEPCYVRDEAQHLITGSYLLCNVMAWPY